MDPISPSFDTWTSGFLIAVAMGLFLFILLITNRNKRNLPIAFLILSFSIILFRYVLYWTRYDQVFQHLNFFSMFCHFTTGPLFYLYFLNLYKRNVKFNYLFHFLPALVLFIPNVQLWLKLAGITSPESGFLILPYSQWILVGQMILYAVLIARLMRAYRLANGEYARVRRNWSKVLLSLYVIFIIAYASYWLLLNLPFFSPEWDYMISFTMSISIYAIGYFIFRQPKVFDGELYNNLFLPDRSKEDSVEDALTLEFYTYLKGYMETEKPYLDNELRLVHLADKVGFSTHLLSKVINDRSGMNFNQFINHYRLEEAERLLIEDPFASIKTIYFDVGFNNKATFYKAFKNKYNCTPSEFKKQLAPS